MNIIRTTRVRIWLDRLTTEETISAWNALCNWLSRIAFENGCITNPVRLHKLCYEEAKSLFGLSSQVTINAIRIVTSRYAGLKKKRSIPRRPVQFRPDTAVLLQGGTRGRDFSFTRHGLSVWTIRGRVKNVRFSGEPKLAEYIEGWTLGDARLFTKKGKVYLSVSFKKTIPDYAEQGNTIGIDRGIRYMAVVTDGKHQAFFGGGHTNHVRDRYLKTRASLQSQRAQKSTRSVRRVLKRLSGREKRFMRDINHRISRQMTSSFPGSVIVLEDLKDIRNGKRLRKKERRRLHCWAFYQLEQFIRYKAEEYGSTVIDVSAKYTSQACSRCGHTEKANRSALSFSCKSCGYFLHSDLNGARNIRLRGILARQALGGNGLLSTSPEARPYDSGLNPDEGTGKLTDLSVSG